MGRRSFVEPAKRSDRQARAGSSVSELPAQEGSALGARSSLGRVGLRRAIFKVLPDAKLAWRDGWVGGVATALLFTVGKLLIGMYIGRSNPGTAFGAASALKDELQRGADEINS